MLTSDCNVLISMEIALNNLINSVQPAPDLDGGGPGAHAWWEAPCTDKDFSVGVINEVISIFTDL